MSVGTVAVAGGVMACAVVAAVVGVALVRGGTLAEVAAAVVADVAAVEAVSDGAETLGAASVGCRAGALEPECVARSAAAIPAATRASPAAITATKGARVRRRRGDASTLVTLVAGSCLSSLRSAAPSCGRSAGSFASAAVVRLSSTAGASRQNAVTGGAVLSRCSSRSRSGSSASNGSRPVSIRKRITPNE